MSTDPTPEPRRLLRCDVCGRTDQPTAADLMQYARRGWPKCCGQVMAYFTESERPAEVGSRLSHKCPVCGFEWAVTLPPGVEVAVSAGECERCRGQTPAVPPT